MKLSLLFDDNQEESIVYLENEVIITTYSSNQVQALLINEDLKQENLQYRQMAIADIDNYELEDLQTEKEKNIEIIKLIEKTIKKSLDLNDFNIFEIQFIDHINLFNYVKFLEKLNNDIIINASNLNKENIEILKTINFKKEPLISYELNTKLTPLSDFLETMDIISTIENAITRFSLSKLEQQMLLFDLIRSRIYKVGNEDDYASSRDLNRVLKEDEIVCAGYANIFAAVSNHLGIPTFVKTYISTVDEKSGHATNVSYYYDSFYNKAFTLEFDATWNSKKNASDKNWINDYNFFAQPESIASFIKEKRSLTVCNSLNQDIETTYQRYLYFLENGALPFCLNNVIKKFVNLLKQISIYHEDNNKIEFFDNFLNELTGESNVNPDFIKKLFLENQDNHHKVIPLEIFLKALYRVRRIEHSLDPKEYPLDYKIIEEICSNKYTYDKLLLKLLVNKENIENIDVLKYIPSKIKNKIGYDISMMKLLHQLRNVSKIQEEKSLTTK